MFKGTKKRIIQIIIAFLISISIGFVSGNIMLFLEGLVIGKWNFSFTIACILAVVIFDIAMYIFVFRNKEWQQFSKLACLMVSYVTAAFSIGIMRGVWHNILFSDGELTVQALKTGKTVLEGAQALYANAIVMYVTFLPISFVSIMGAYAIYIVLKVVQVIKKED